MGVHVRREFTSLRLRPRTSNPVSEHLQSARGYGGPSPLAAPQLLTAHSSVPDSLGLGTGLLHSPRLQKRPEKAVLSQGRLAQAPGPEGPAWLGPGA